MLSSRAGRFRSPVRVYMMEWAGSCAIEGFRKIRKTVCKFKVRNVLHRRRSFFTPHFGPKAGGVLGFGVYGRICDHLQNRGTVGQRSLGILA